MSQKRLETQVAIALSADIRATIFAAMYTMLAVLAIALYSGADSAAISRIGIVLLICAACLAAYSARPVNFHAPGASFADLQEDIASDVASTDVYTELGAYADKHIQNNKLMMGQNAVLFVLSAAIASLGAGFCIISHTL